MKYQVEVDGFPFGEPLAKTNAVKEASKKAGEGHEVFVSWYRESDGTHGYLNRDGNHSPTGKQW